MTDIPLPSGHPAPIDALSAGFISAMRLLARGVKGGSTMTRGRAFALSTQVPVAIVNGVWILDRQTEPDDVQAAAHHVRATGMPWCVQARPECAPAVLDRPERFGLGPPGTIPLLATDGLRPRVRPAELAIRRLSPGEVGLHSQVGCRAFEAPRKEYDRYATRTLMQLPGVRVYVGEVRGVPVATAISMVAGQTVGIFNVATLPGHRRRGYGAAVTSHVVGQALSGGASWIWLQSSKAGYGVYESLGFALVERWTMWTSQ